MPTRGIFRTRPRAGSIRLSVPVRPVGDPDGVEAISDRVGAVSDRDRRHLPARSSVYLRDGAIELVDDPHLAVSHGNAGGPLADPDAVLDPPGRGVDTKKETIGRVGHPHRTGAGRDPT